MTPSLRLSLQRGRDLDALVRELNTRILPSIEQSIAQARAQDGYIAALSGDLDLGGHRILNVGRSNGDSGVPTRAELRERGLYALPGDPLETLTPIIARGGLLVADSSVGGTSSTPRTISQIALEMAQRAVDSAAVNAQLHTLMRNGTTIGTRPALNLIEGANVTLTATDDPANSRVNVEVAASGGGYTDEQAQDAIGLILLDTTSIDFTYDDATPTISAVVLPAGVNHNLLANLAVGDVHTHYLLLAGRAGAANNATLSTTADGTLTGSGAALFALNLVGGPTGTRTSAQPYIRLQAQMGNVGNGVAVAAEFAHDATFDHALSILNGATVSEHGTWNVTTNLVSAAPYGGLAGSRIFVSAPTITSSADRTDLGSHSGFFFAPQMTAPVGVTISGGVSHSVYDLPYIGGAANAGTVTWPTHYAVLSRPTIQPNTGAATLTNRYGYYHGNRQGTGTQTNSYGVYIEDQTVGTLAASLWSVGAAVQLRHTGPVRIGDLTAATEKLEVLGNVLLDNGGTAAELRLREPSGGGSSYTGFKAPALGGNVLYTLPTGFPAADGHLLSSTTGGVMSWAAPGAGSVDIVQLEVDLGATWKRSGKFTIADASILAGSFLIIGQAGGPYTGKGTRADEAELVSMLFKPTVTGAGTADVYWETLTRAPIRGNIKINYLIG